MPKAPKSLHIFVLCFVCFCLVFVVMILLFIVFRISESQSLRVLITFFFFFVSKLYVSYFGFRTGCEERGKGEGGREKGEGGGDWMNGYMEKKEVKNR